jgi:Rps23 Pro-64 3,4-dihydroxylase Tpa1-like proline 4-hydroxylase
MFDDALNKIVASESHTYPFPHLLIENLLPSNFMVTLQKDIGELKNLNLSQKFESEFGVKQEWKEFPEKLSSLSHFTVFMSSELFIKTLSKKFGLSQTELLTPDNTYDGGGYVESPKGSHLSYHADFNFSSKTGKYRVMNVLFYMNEDYLPEHGGHLHLLDADSKTVEKIVHPQANTMLAFLTDDVSFHGVSRNRASVRKSFNFYYYSDQPLSPNQSETPHKTLWVSQEAHQH